MKKKIYIPIIIISICLIFTILIGKACISKKVYNENSRDYLVYSINKFPEDLLLLNDNNIRNKDLELCIFEGLVSVDANGKITPALASSFKVSDDKLTYTFNIRENAKWSNGDKISSEDFVDFFSRILKEQNNIYAEQLDCIFGLKEYRNNKIDFHKVAITTNKDKQLEVRLNYPCEDFLKILSEPVFTLKKNFYNLRNWKSQYKKIDYSGAFIIENIYDNGEISLKKNEKYWDNKSVLSNKIHIKDNETTAFMLAEYNSNRVDVFCNEDMLQMEGIKQEEKSKRKFTGEGVGLNFNLNNDNFVRDIRFRKAIKYCINKDNIEKHSGELFTKTTGYLKSSKLNDKYINYNAQIVQSKELLKNSSYNGETIRIAYLNSEDRNKKIIKSIIKDLKDLKVNIDVKGYNKEQFKSVMYKDEYDMVLVNYSGEYNSSLCYLEKWISNSKFNTFGYKNVNFDTCVLKGKMCNNKTEAERNFNAAENILLDDIPVIPIGFYNFVLCKKDYVQGIEINDMGNIILKKACISNKK